MVSWRGHCWVGLWFEWRRNPSRELCQNRRLPPSALLAHFFVSLRASLVAQMVKNLPAMQETCVRFLGWEKCPGERNGYPFQYSCLENPMDRGA